ncbi:LAME_0B01926g1_1 [Lachancea meyersii CBS 8951]|uniref:LAME_0B01926g1_1 n=1 Tax=Lachancea meyersii CBS 8951 TaxID=1266667 RepID=A0A1G4IU14_9SACH|nr:LAME_0B01926g1_1 [Lachancea meyersii CBS 8951]
MAPCLFMTQVAPGVVLPIRIFINRKQIAKNIEDARPSFETPILSNNSIIRLKSPLVRLYLSNTDARNLCEEIKDELMLILYELTAKKVHESVTGKLKIGNLVEFKDILEKLPSLRSAFQWDSHPCGILTLERTAKYQYKLHYDRNWSLDIFIDDIRKLSRIRDTLLARLFPGSALQGSMGSMGSPGMKVLRRTRQEIPAPLSTTEKPQILRESEDDMTLPDDIGEGADGLQKAEVSVNTTKDEKKPQFRYRHLPMLNLGNCINIHVLRRPKRAQRTSI